MSLRLGQGALLAVLATGAATFVAHAQGPKPDVVVPFKIQVSDAVLSDLKDRLARTRFPAEIPGADAPFPGPFKHGPPHPLAQRAVAELRSRVDRAELGLDQPGGGKMFGVLVVEHAGQLGFLSAFSGMVSGSW